MTVRAFVIVALLGFATLANAAPFHSSASPRMPEPVSLSLMGGGLLACSFLRRKCS